MVDPTPILGELQATSARLLAMAVDLLGEVSKVRNHMKLSEAELAAIVAGERHLTCAELDMLTSLLIREQGSMIAKNRDLAELLRLRATRS